MSLALIVSAGANANEYLANHIAELGYNRPVIVASGGEARRQLGEKVFDIVLINAPLPDEFGHELAAYAVERSNAGVALLVKAGTADQIAGKMQERGVLVLGKPFSAVQFRQCVQMAASCCRRLAILQEENDRLTEKIAQLRLVDRAKCFLIEHKGMTETDAHRLIEKQAMDTRRSRGEIAQEILAEEDDY
ncbi:MAG: ANTAR domain-containing response regulator [Gemmiger sp.]